MANRQHLIEQREGLQFHSDLAFGKLVSKHTASATVPSLTNNLLSVAHEFQTRPSIIGWVTLDAHTERLPLKDINISTFDEYGFDVQIYPYANDTDYGFYIVNAHGSSHSVNFTYWLYFV